MSVPERVQKRASVISGFMLSCQPFLSLLPEAIIPLKDPRKSIRQLRHCSSRGNQAPDFPSVSGHDSFLP